MWIVIIVIIVIVVYNANASNKEKERQNAISLKKEIELNYCNEIDDLFKRCFNNNTRMFDWDYYYEHKDPYDDDKDVMSDYAYEKFLDERFHAGMRFISYLNYYIQLGNSTLNYQNMLYEIRKREHNLLCNIVFMCGGDKCPKCIKDYVDEVYKLIESKYPCTKERLEKIVRMVPIDLQRNR